ncbi:D-alanine--D-alanine ligase [Candidatus Woesebacteria bacterium]|nr:D-alanine--D-alanine ligase [Candidatus Woesebacteria bacterium]
MTRLGVIFGSRSVEHEVSIITACQLMKHVNTENYSVVPLYIDKRGKWWTGDRAKTIDSYKNQDLTNPTGFEATNLLADPLEDHGIDVAIICTHGTYGEDGSIQGLLELAGIPYQGPGIVGSALCMDKILTKQVLMASGIPVVPFQWCTRDEWTQRPKEVLSRLLDTSVPHTSRLSFPLFVKPANLGSSVGISKATDELSLQAAIEVAFQFDRRVLIEQGKEAIKEINVSVLGFNELIASTPEEPVSSGELLSYSDKYEQGGKKTGGMASLRRRIPAPIPMSLTKKIQETAVNACKQLDVSGVVRIDFLVNPGTGEYWLNELNTIPGSMSFYLWEASGISYPELIDRLVAIAMERNASMRNVITSIATPIITTT